MWAEFSWVRRRGHGEDCLKFVAGFKFAGFKFAGFTQKMILTGMSRIVNSRPLFQDPRQTHLRLASILPA
jgi:hypothetical protein